MSSYFSAMATTTNYNVIDTDYENFSIVYSCNNKLFFKTGKYIQIGTSLLYIRNKNVNFTFFITFFYFLEIMWILTRQQFPSPYLIKNIKKRIRALGLDTRRLRKTNQKSCPAVH